MPDKPKFYQDYNELVDLMKKSDKYNPEARCIKAGRRNSAGGEQRSSFTGGMIILLFMISAGI